MTDWDQTFTDEHPAPTNSSNDGRCWFALRVKSNRERVTAAALRCKGYEEFLPAFCRSPKGPARPKLPESPMFPGYVFARFNKNHRLPILMLPGVVHVVGMGKEPVPIDTAELESIRAIVASGSNAQPWPYVRAGQRVSVVRGPLLGAQGVILASKSECRLVASLTLLQRSVSVEIERDWIEVDPPGQRLRAS